MEAATSCAADLADSARLTFPWFASPQVEISPPLLNFIDESIESSRSEPIHSFWFAALSPELKSTLDAVVSSHKVVLFMKGTKDFPQCGFSHTVVQILKSLNVPFETTNILENEMLRQGLKEYSSWPTFPQLYIDGEFFGGCDITVGELASFCLFLSLFVLNLTNTIVAWYRAPDEKSERVALSSR